MQNFEELLNDAAKTADARTKAFRDLRAAAPGILTKYATAMLALGYQSTRFSNRLFVDQRQFATGLDDAQSAIRFSFKDLTFTEATDFKPVSADEWDYVFNGDVYPLDFTRNTVSRELLKVLQALPNNLARCTEAAKKQTAEVDNILNSLPA